MTGEGIKDSQVGVGGQEETGEGKEDSQVSVRTGRDR